MDIVSTSISTGQHSLLYKMKSIFTLLPFQVMSRENIVALLTPFYTEETGWESISSFPKFWSWSGEQLLSMEFCQSYSLESLSNTLQGLNFQKTCLLPLLIVTIVYIQLAPNQKPASSFLWHIFKALLLAENSLGFQKLLGLKRTRSLHCLSWHFGVERGNKSIYIHRWPRWVQRVLRSMVGGGITSMKVKIRALLILMKI